MKKNIHRSLFLFTDFIASFLAWISFFILRKRILHEIPEALSVKLFIHAVIIGCLWVILYALSGSYNDIYRKSRIKEFLKILSTGLIGAIIIFFGLLLDDEGIIAYTYYYKTFSAYFLIHILFTAITKLFVLTYIKGLVKNRSVLFNSILIGSGVNAKEIVEAVEKNRKILGFTFVGYVHLGENNKGDLISYLPHLGSFNRIGNFIKENKVEHIVIAVDECDHHRIQFVLRELENYNVKVSIIPDIYDLLLGAVKVSHVFTIPLIEINQDLIPTWQKAVKRMVDIFASLLVLIIGSPFLLVISLLTKFSSKGPILYSQERIGKDGIPFKIYKFRSMYMNAESTGPALSSPDDPRITPWGRVMRRTKIDEFPQFYNVLIGDMAIVGPRPERQYFIEQIVKIAPHYRHLQRVKPGITSLGQVKYGYAENVHQMVKRLKYDIIYIENMSLTLDFQIILYTMVIMFSGRSK